MGFGIALGGAAKGLESAEGALARSKQLGLQEQTMLGDQKLRERALGIQERQLDRAAKNDLTAQANEIMAQELGVIGEVIKAGKAAGHSPEQINAAIEPLLADVEELAPTVGRDPARIRTMVGASVNAPATTDPDARKKGLEIDKLEREAAGERVALEDRAISANAALSALDTIESIPGAEAFLLTPDLIAVTRQALSAGNVDPTGIVKGLPSKLSGIPQEQLAVALDAAETVNKQRNALGQGLSNQAGAAGLASRLQSLGQGAGLDVQRSVFRQALDRDKREAEASGKPLDLGETETAAGKSKERVFETKEDLDLALDNGQVKAGDTINVGGDTKRTFAGRFPSREQFEDAVKKGLVKAEDIVVIGGQMFKAVD